MKKILLFLSVIICGNLFAQINQTFVPESGKSYYIKVQDFNKDVYLSYLVDDNTGFLSFQSFTASEADSKTLAQWTIEYVAGNGYTLKNKATGKYFTTANPSNVGNAINASSASLTNACYFEFRTIEKPFFIGGVNVSFTKQSYGIIIPETNLSFDAYNNDSYAVGAWGWNNGYSPNQNWIFLEASELAIFEDAVSDRNKKNQFIPVAGTKYYIKNRQIAEEQSYLADNEGVLTFASLDNDEVKTQALAQWNIVLDETNGGYLFQNIGSHKYINFVSNNTSPGGFSTNNTGNYLILDTKDNSNVPFSYTYTHSSTGNTFSLPSFRILYDNGGYQGLDRAGDNIGSWGGNLGINQKWLILTEPQLDKFAAVLNGGTTTINNLINKKDAYCIYDVNNKTIKIKGPSISKIRLFDYNGRDLGNYSYPAQIDEANIDVSALVAGVYIIHVTAQNGNSTALKYLKK